MLCIADVPRSISAAALDSSGTVLDTSWLAIPISSSTGPAGTIDEAQEDISIGAVELEYAWEVGARLPDANAEWPISIAEPRVPFAATGAGVAVGPAPLLREAGDLDRRFLLIEPFSGAPLCD